MSRTILIGAGIAALVGIAFAASMKPDIDTRPSLIEASPVAARAEEPVAPSRPQAVYIPTAAQATDLYGHPWQVVGSTGCAYLDSYADDAPSAYVTLMQNEGVPVQVMEASPNLVAIGNPRTSPRPVQIITRGPSCGAAQSMLAEMRADY